MPESKKTQSKSKRKPASSKKKSTKSTDSKKQREQTIFFTGYPGFIGRRIVREILQRYENPKIVLLIQRKFATAAEKALIELKEVEPKAVSAVSTVFGDLTEPNLGLSEAEFRKLADSLSEVWHLAAAYDLAMTEAVGFRINVEGTGRVLDLCHRAKHFEKLVYMSTCYVSGTREGLILEEDFDLGQSFHNHYEATKFEAEVLVRENMDKIPTIILRPAIVIGESDTGETDKFDGFYYLVRSYVQLAEKFTAFRGVRLPVAGRPDVPMNFVPVDFVAKAAVIIGQNTANIGGTFHLADPNPMSFQEVASVVSGELGLGDPIFVVPEPVVRFVGKLPLLSDWVGVPAQIIPFLYNKDVFETRNMRRALEADGTACPSLREYLPRVVEFVRKYPRFLGGPKY